jgi:hypothetical protein
VSLLAVSVVSTQLIMKHSTSQESKRTSSGSVVLHSAALLSLLDLINATISGAQSLSQAAQLSTISDTQSLSQAPQCTFINNIRCTVPVTSSTLYIYRQYPVHSPGHKMHNVHLSTISEAQSLSQAPQCTIINNIRCTVPVTCCTMYIYQQYPMHSPCHKLYNVQ